VGRTNLPLLELASEEAVSYHLTKWQWAGSTWDSKWTRLTDIFVVGGPVMKWNRPWKNPLMKWQQASPVHMRCESIVGTTNAAHELRPGRIQMPPTKQQQDWSTWEPVAH
jgi:hypothetical protein